MHKLKSFLLVTLLLIGVTTSNAQCAMCKAVVENGDASMAEGINNGITYLMVFPYILVGALLFTIYRYNKKSKK